MLKARIKEAKLLHLVAHRNGQVRFEFQLDKKKLLIGRAAHCDIVIDDNTISHYHAMIIIDEHGGKIIDLDSDNGVFLNNNRVPQTFFSDGDTLKLGPIELNVEERIIEHQGTNTICEDQDNDLEKLDQQQIEELPPELPPAPGLVVIDGEYCDIVFEESNLENHSQLQAFDDQLDFNDYIDPTPLEDVTYEPIARKQDKLAIEVSVLINGNIISVDYLPLKNKTYYVSADRRVKNTIHMPCLEEQERIPLIDVDGAKVSIHKLSKFSARLKNNDHDIFSNTEEYELTQKESAFYTYKDTQICVRLTNAPSYLKYAPFFGRDREFQKHTAKVFGTIMGIMMLLLFVDTTIDPPQKKKIAVIYRKAIKAKEKSDQRSKSVADKKDENTGVKKNKQPNKKVKMAKKAAPAKKKPTKAPKKVAKAAAKSQKVKKKPKMKAYKFKSKNKLSSLLGSTKSLKPTKVNKRADSSATTGFKSSSNVSDSNLAATSDSSATNMGKDFSGNYDSSSGAQGLSSKSGVDTTYTDPKTVVLGSMDPELLRKILKEYLPQFRHCYQKELERNDAAKGVIDLHFRINADGSVNKINIKGKNAQFSAKGNGCMGGVLKLINFPKPKGGGVVDVKQPLNFFSEKGGY